VVNKVHHQRNSESAKDNAHTHNNLKRYCGYTF